MEIAWRHLTYYIDFANEEVRSQSHLMGISSDLPHSLACKGSPLVSQVMRRIGKESLEVQFFNEKVQAKHVVQESACKKFADCHVDPKDSAIELYDAFLLARKERTRQTKTEEEECTHEEVGKEWGVAELKTCIDSLLTELPSASVSEKMKLSLRDFTARKEDMRAYMSELLTQKLSYLLSKADMDPSLRIHLESVQRSLTELLSSQFELGTL